MNPIDFFPDAGYNIFVRFASQRFSVTLLIFEGE